MNRICILVLALMLSNCLFAAEKIRVAVLDMQAKNASKDLALAVTDLIRIELLKYDVYEMLDRDNMNIILKEQAFQQSGCTSAECAVEIGQILNCQYMFVGALSKIGESFYISMQRVNVETGRVDFADNREVEKENVLPKAARDLAGQMAAGKVKKKKVWREASRSWRIELGANMTSLGEQQLLLDHNVRGEEVVCGGEGLVLGFRYCPGWRSRFTFGANASVVISNDVSEFIYDSELHGGEYYKVSYRGYCEDFIGFEGRLYVDISDKLGLSAHTVKVMGGFGMGMASLQLETVIVNLDDPIYGPEGQQGTMSSDHEQVNLPFETLGIALCWWKFEFLAAMRFHNGELAGEKHDLGESFSYDTKLQDFPLREHEFSVPQGRSRFISLSFLF